MAKIIPDGGTLWVKWKDSVPEKSQMKEDYGNGPFRAVLNRNKTTFTLWRSNQSRSIGIVSVMYLEECPAPQLSI